MKIIDKTENVGHYEIYSDSVFIGRDTRIKEGMISQGNQILKKTNKGIEILKEEAYHYFTAFKDGILYNTIEGDSIYYSNTIDTNKYTPKQHYFSPLDNIHNRNEVIIIEMDKKFNQKYFLLNSTDFRSKIECKIFPQLNNNQYFCKFHKKESWIEIINKQTDYSYKKINIQFGENKMDKREKPILDSNFLFIPLNRGVLAKYNCISDSYEWINSVFGEQYVSYDTNNLYVFQHFGMGINQISKASGKTINQIYFSELIKENYHSSGRIWCSDDYVITKDLTSGKFCVLDANTLKILGLEFVMKKGFSDSKTTFQIMNNKIYVLGMNNILTEYEM
jgi:hypothetical protein